MAGVMRMTLFPHIVMTGIDFHGLLPPTAPPPNPAAPIPTYAMAHVHASLAGGWFLTGKYTLSTSKTDGHGEILWQYDHGFLGIHTPVPPQASPSIVFLLLGSSSKFWMPSSQIQHTPDGGLLALANRSSPVAVAVSLPVFMISVQNCQDIGAAFSFVAPTGFSFQNMSTRYVNFTVGDFLAGLFGMIGDAVAALILSYFGGKMFPDSVRDNFFCGVASNFGAGVGGSFALAPAIGIIGAVVGGIGGSGLTMFGKDLAGRILYTGVAAGAAIITTWLASQAGSAVSPPADATPTTAAPAAALPSALPPPAASAPSQPPPAASTDDTTPPGPVPSPADTEIPPTGEPLPGGAPKQPEGGVE